MPRIGLKPGPVCFTRPNRTRDREFLASDLARLYCKQIKDGIFTHEDFVREVDKRCGFPREDTTDWRRQIQDVLDALEAVLEELLKTVGPSGAKVLARIYKLLPPAIRARIERALGELLGKVIGKIRDTIDKVKRLPPQP